MCSKYRHYFRFHNYYNWERSMWSCKEKRSFNFTIFQLLHMNYDFVIWNDNLCGSQLPTGWGQFPIWSNHQSWFVVFKVPKRRKSITTPMRSWAWWHYLTQESPSCRVVFIAYLVVCRLHFCIILVRCGVLIGECMDKVGLYGLWDVKIVGYWWSWSLLNLSLRIVFAHDKLCM